MRMPKRSGRIRLPPFGKDLAAARRRGDYINLFIHTGDHSWSRARLRDPPHILCLPPEADPADYDWSICAGLEITLIVWGRDMEFTDVFARLLIVAGAMLVVALNNEPSQSAFYKAQVQR